MPKCRELLLLSHSLSFFHVLLRAPQSLEWRGSYFLHATAGAGHSLRIVARTRAAAVVVFWGGCWDARGAFLQSALSSASTGFELFRPMASLTSVALLLLLSFPAANTFGIEDIVPGHKIVAQIGDQLALRCRVTGCESPFFSWRTQLDHPLGGKLHEQGNSSVLTIESVGFQHEHQYVCTAGCRQGESSKEKAIMVDIFSFPSDPIIELQSPLILGKPASVTCRVPDVYPSDQLKIILMKAGKTFEKEFFQDSHIKLLQTKILQIDFTPSEEDFGKEITCVAELLIEDMALKPNQRQTTNAMNIYYGPRNTHIIAFPGTTIAEGEALTLSCMTESHPQGHFAWKKQLVNGITQNGTENQNFSIPNPRFSDSGIYICEVTNEITNEVERISLTVSIQVSSPSTPALTAQSEMNTSFTTDVAPTTIAFFSSSVTSRMITNEISIKIDRVEEPDYVTPIIIAASCLAAAAGPVTALLIYMFRKVKINGSYSLVNSLKPNVQV